MTEAGFPQGQLLCSHTDCNIQQSPGYRPSNDSHLIIPRDTSARSNTLQSHSHNGHYCHLSRHISQAYIKRCDQLNETILKRVVGHRSTPLTRTITIHIRIVRKAFGTVVTAPSARTDDAVEAYCQELDVNARKREAVESRRHVVRWFGPIICCPELRENCGAGIGYG